MLIRINCPNPQCKKQLRIDVKHAGKKISCAECKQHIRLPTAVELKLPVQVSTGAVTETPSAPGAEEQVIDFDMLASEAVVQEKVAQQEDLKETMVEFVCPQCDEPIKVSAENAGKRAPCPSCRRIIAVPKMETGKTADWREKVVQGPSLAKKDVVKLDGEWGNQAAARVSLEALEEAKALPKIKRKLTVRDYVRYGIYGAMLIAIAGTSWWGWNRYRASSLEGNTVAGVRQAIQTTKSVPEMHAVLRRSIGEWLLQPGNTLEEQREGLAELRQVTAAASDPLWVWVLDSDIANIVGPLVSLDPKQDKPLVDLNFLVQLIAGNKASETREDVVRILCKGVLKQAQGDPEKLQLAQNLLTTVIKQAIPAAKLTPPAGAPAKTALPSMDYSDQLNAIGVLAQELMRIDARDQAMKLIGKTTASGERVMYKPGMPIPKTFVAALTALSLPELEVPKADEAEVELGKMVGHFLGNQDGPGNEILKKKQEGGYAETNLLAYLAIAEQAITNNRKPEALVRLSEAMKIAQIYALRRNVSWSNRVYAHVKLCYLTALAGEVALAEERIAQLKLEEVPTADQVARGLVARLRTVQAGDGDTLLAGLPANSPAQALVAFQLSKKQVELERTASTTLASKLGEGPAKHLAQLGGLLGAKQAVVKK